MTHITKVRINPEIKTYARWLLLDETQEALSDYPIDELPDHIYRMYLAYNPTTSITRRTIKHQQNRWVKIDGEIFRVKVHR